MKIFVIAVLLAIVASLAQALSALASGPDRAERVARALTVRIALSLALFAFLMSGWYFGFIAPHGVG